uniref:Uncharacterized protein n=1 Tax=Chrysotila carterae TaxID=13221 RepID=A0A7S4C0I1_CHRCT|eukprot:304775-Pleurochrysis_carterae.AAC.3
MLAADKDTLVAALKQRALDLRQRELDYYVERYSNITTQASIVAGFAFDALVELDVTKEMHDDLVRHGREWIEIAFYFSTSLTMAFGLYTVCVSSFATVYGHRLALQGPTGSVERAVAIMMKQRNGIFVTFGLSMLFLVLGAIFMAWIKMGVSAGGVTAVFGLFFLSLVRKHQDMKHLFNIPLEVMVAGDLRLNAGDVPGSVDISRLEAGFGDDSSNGRFTHAPPHQTMPMHSATYCPALGILQRGAPGPSGLGGACRGGATFMDFGGPSGSGAGGAGPMGGCSAGGGGLGGCGMGAGAICSVPLLT